MSGIIFMKIHPFTGKLGGAAVEICKSPTLRGVCHPYTVSTITSSTRPRLRRLFSGIQLSSSSSSRLSTLSTFTHSFPGGNRLFAVSKLAGRPCSTLNRNYHFTATTYLSSSSRSSEEQEAIDFLIRIGHDHPHIANGVVDALKESGLSGSMLLNMIQSLAGRWEVGEDAGLEDLVEAVRVNQLKKEGRAQIKLLVIPSNAWKSSEEDAEDYADIIETKEEYDEALKRAYVVEAMTGLTLTDVAKFGEGPGADHLGESIECACAGIMACSTCHVVIDPEWFDKGVVEQPSESELDMLDLAYAPRRTSRLGCQIVLDESMDGMVIRLPKSANNLMDFVPFSE